MGLVPTGIASMKKAPDLGAFLFRNLFFGRLLLHFDLDVKWITLWTHAEGISILIL